MAWEPPYVPYVNDISDISQQHSVGTSELGAEPKTLNMVTKRSATELHLSPKCL